MKTENPNLEYLFRSSPTSWWRACSPTSGPTSWPRTHMPKMPSILTGKDRFRLFGTLGLSGCLLYHQIGNYTVDITHIMNMYMWLFDCSPEFSDHEYFCSPQIMSSLLFKFSTSHRGGSEKRWPEVNIVVVKWGFFYWFVIPYQRSTAGRKVVSLLPKMWESCFRSV